MSYDDEDVRQYVVVLNDEEQYSIWPADRDLPSGWRHAGMSGTKAECVKHIGEVWTDMRPLSLRRRMEALRAGDAARVLVKRTTVERPAVAFMFAGQGSQSVGMGAELYRTERVYREQVEECLARLDAGLASELRALLLTTAPPSSEQSARLQDTELAQPALFVTEYALSRLLESWGVRPDVLIGHSIGEYGAACLAGVFSLDDALRLVAARGRLMQAMPPGKMLSIACTPAQLREQLPADVDVAAVNGPRQCVVAGSADTIAQLERDLLARGIAACPLRTSHAFHSRLMEPMLEPFARELARTTFHEPAIACVSNVTGSLAAPELLADPQYWVRHVRQPVLFAQGVQSLLARGARLLVEIGPGRTLSALARQGGAETKGATIVDVMPGGTAQASEALWIAKALAKLRLAGASVEQSALYTGEQRSGVAGVSE
jgi:acyl transferase domain-containing protein